MQSKNALHGFFLAQCEMQVDIYSELFLTKCISGLNPHTDNPADWNYISYSGLKFKIRKVYDAWGSNNIQMVH